MKSGTVPELTKNQRLVHDVLVSTGSSLSAYGILDSLREDGFRAPLQVYRALDKLMELGMVHRLESRNAFIACSHPDCESRRTIAFMICEKCETVFELGDEGLIDHLDKLAANENFQLQQSTVELLGLCASCRN